MLFAWTFTEAMQYAVRGGAALVGLVVGWYASKPLANFLSRLAFQRPVAPELLPLIRAIAAVGLAVLFYVIVPAGTGPGGPGGPGTGRDKSTGADKSSDKSAKDNADKDGPNIDKGRKGEDAPDLIRVEILGGKRYPGNEKWYLFQRKDPPLDKTELKERIKKHLMDSGLKSARLQPVITDDTIANWGLSREPELREIRLELGLQPVDRESLE